MNLRPEANDGLTWQYLGCQWTAHPKGASMSKSRRVLARLLPLGAALMLLAGCSPSSPPASTSSPTPTVWRSAQPPTPLRMRSRGSTPQAQALMLEQFVYAPGSAQQPVRFPQAPRSWPEHGGDAADQLVKNFVGGGCCHLPIIIPARRGSSLPARPAAENRPSPGRWAIAVFTPRPSERC